MAAVYTETKVDLEHFTNFRIEKDAGFLATGNDGKTYEIESIIKYGDGGNTVVYYLDHEGRPHDLVQSHGREYVEREY